MKLSVYEVIDKFLLIILIYSKFFWCYVWIYFGIINNSYYYIGIYKWWILINEIEKLLLLFWFDKCGKWLRFLKNICVEI